MRRPPSVQVFLVTLRKGSPSYLLFRRRGASEMDGASSWQGVIGPVSYGETSEEAAIRHVLETTGLSLTTVYNAECPIDREGAEYRSRIFNSPTYLYFALVSGKVLPTLSTDLFEWRWCTGKQAIELLSGPSADSLRFIEERW